MNNFGLFLTGYKGLCFLQRITYVPSFVVTCDNQEGSDCYEKIINFCTENNIKCYEHKKFDDVLDSVEMVFVVGWQFLIKQNLDKFIVFHDSYLPERKGFCPVVSSLLDESDYVGASCFHPTQELDSGSLLFRRKKKIKYPIKIKDAFDYVVEMYVEMFYNIINDNSTKPISIGDDKLSYTVWRDEEDFRINWEKTSSHIKQKIYSLGYPYRGSTSLYDGNLIYIQDAEIVPELNICNREDHIGKIWEVEDNNPIIICGQGMLKILKANESNGDDVVFNKIRKRFK
ncbi:hypothetical protein CMI47_22070 [Candidatus Pacearchaeota archaeon]|nr:hypothetical protein [Candidatus Pacearchaeota archaeon]|tara:strand:+ start:5330 stop:6187 length:858 start_codon:yes stop_codon:yes gene_type:complete